MNDLLARATFAAAVKRWPGAKITLRNGAGMKRPGQRTIKAKARPPRCSAREHRGTPGAAAGFEAPANRVRLTGAQASRCDLCRREPPELM